MSLGLTFPLCIVLGFFLGRWLGAWFGHGGVGQWIGLMLGIAAAFRELYKLNQRAASQDEKERKRLPEEKGPRGRG